MSYRRYVSRARRSLIVGALASTLVVTHALPVVTQLPDVARAGPRHGQGKAASAERKKQRNVTKTFSSDAAITIPDSRVLNALGEANPYPSTITVAGFKQGRVLDVNVTLRGLSHTFPPDVAVMLVAPDGRNALVMADVGRADVNEEVTNLTITLDDEAASPMPAFERITSGAFRPTDGDLPGLDGEFTTFTAPAPTPSGATTLSTFDDINPNGAWQLFVLDDDAQDAGAIDRGWTLDITAKTKSAPRHTKGKH